MSYNSYLGGSMSRAKLFIENFLIYGLGNIISKIVPLIMLPLVTRLMPDSTYYGLADLSNITVTFISAVAIMGMYDAMFRMFFEKDDVNYKKKVCSSALFFVLVNSLILSIVFFLFKEYISKLIFSDIKYINLLNITNLAIFTSSISSIMQAPTRMQNKRKVFLITNTISPIIGYFISIPLLLNKQYLYALPLASFLSSTIMLIVFYILNNNWFSIKFIDKKLIKEMLRFGIPLMPTFLIYWIFNSSDRLMIGKIIGNSYVGIYGVGARVASISQFTYAAFASGWQYFAFSTMKDNDQVLLTSKVFEYLGLIAFNFFIVLLPFVYSIFNLLFKGDYRYGYMVFPYLFMSPLLLMLYQTGVNQFLVIKKTIYSTLILLFGAFINVLMNLLLIPILGIEGASIATFISYCFSVYIAVIKLRKLNLILIKKRFIYISLATLVYLTLWRTLLVAKLFLSLIIALIFLFFINKFYISEIKVILSKVMNLKNKLT